MFASDDDVLLATSSHSPWAGPRWCEEEDGAKGSQKSHELGSGGGGGGGRMGEARTEEELVHVEGVGLAEGGGGGGGGGG